MKTDIDFANTKLYTQDEVLIEKYAKLCGCEYKRDKEPEAGVYFNAKREVLDGFAYQSPIDGGHLFDGETVTQLTPEQVETEYAKRFGLDAPNTNKIEPHPEGLEYNRVGDSEVLWLNGVCVYRKEGDRVEVVLPGEDKLPALEDVLSKLRSLSA